MANAPTRSSKPITVTLGKQQASVDARLARGDYASASEVVRAALRALDREEDALNAYYRTKIQEALDDPRPDLLADDAWASIERLHAETLKKSGQ
ncbi:type II toxin-antitoxin system ParD family antitoxin [Escherichia coli]|nr:type II toxin-antitoxin system ParD family antitoxin [Escherichia coli]